MSTHESRRNSRGHERRPQTIQIASYLLYDSVMAIVRLLPRFPMAFLLAALLSGANAAESPKQDVFTVKQLANNCRIAGGNGYFLCIGYLRGVLEAQSTQREESRNSCLPAFAVGDRRKVFMDWYRRSDIPASTPAVEAVQRAFTERYPC